MVEINCDKKYGVVVFKFEDDTKFRITYDKYEKALDIQKTGANLSDKIQITPIVTNVIKVK